MPEVCFLTASHAQGRRADYMKVIDVTNSALETWRPGVETRMVVSRVNGARATVHLRAVGRARPRRANPYVSGRGGVDGARGRAEMWVDEQRDRRCRPVADRAGRTQARLSQFRYDDAAHPCGAGLADVRGDDVRRGGSGAAMGLTRGRRLATAMAMVMPQHLGPIPAIAHRAPSPILSPAFVDKEPAASALILALPHFPGTRSHEQPDGRPRDRPKQIVCRAVTFV